MKTTWFLLPLTLGLLTLVGCNTLPEATQDFDIVFGPDYTPPIEIRSEELPKRALLVAVKTKGEEGRLDGFLRDFRADFGAFPIETIDPSKPLLTAMPTRADVMTAARANLCDAILYINLREESVYAPPRITAEVILQKVEDGLVLWKGLADYDASKKPVANSARRYTQKIADRTNTPDRSLSILNDSEKFQRFAAWHLTSYLNYLGKYFPVIVRKKAPEEPGPTPKAPQGSANPAQPKSF